MSQGTLKVIDIYWNRISNKLKIGNLMNMYDSMHTWGLSFDGWYELHIYKTVYFPFLLPALCIKTVIESKQ